MQIFFQTVQKIFDPRTENTKQVISNLDLYEIRIKSSNFYFLDFELLVYKAWTT